MHTRTWQVVSLAALALLLPVSVVVGQDGGADQLRNDCGTPAELPPLLKLRGFPAGSLCDPLRRDCPAVGFGGGLIEFGGGKMCALPDDADSAFVEMLTGALGELNRDGDGNPITESSCQDLVFLQMCNPNNQAAGVLNQMDIDQDGLPDGARDSDGDGLPDNWELGGVEPGADRVVFYPNPSAIVPGTPPTPIFSRPAVATSALSADTDEDGLSDFIEVFGLMFIDDNRNGVLDSDEWADLNNDGLPSPGEYPLSNAGRVNWAMGTGSQPALFHDFDGFVFTDPTARDTDGDGKIDGEDNDPLIDPKSFGLDAGLVVRFDRNKDEDIDRDGLGNGMDMGNDLDGRNGVTKFQVIDNPENIRDILELFRKDLLRAGVVPESVIEDLIGADWDGNGLWRTTDVRDWHIVIVDDDTEANSDLKPPEEFFQLTNGRKLYAQQSFADIATVFNDKMPVDACEASGDGSLEALHQDRCGHCFNTFDRYACRGIGLGWQEALRPAATSTSQFLPDTRIWAILYAWRMPGFDIDGDGFVGVPSKSNTAVRSKDESLTVVLENQPRETVLASSVAGVEDDDSFLPFDDRIQIGEEDLPAGRPDGRIDVDPILRNVCGAAGMIPLGMLVAGLALLRMRRRPWS